MERRQLGRTGFTVNPIGLGTTKLGRNTEVKYPASFELPSDDQVRELLASAERLDVNFIDTAPAYGESERRLGDFVASHRDKIVLSTKCGEQYIDGRSIYDFSIPAISASVENSLRRLRTDFVDLLLLHSDGKDLELLTQTDALEALAKLKMQGKIRSAGISAKTANGILEATRTLDVVMAPFSEKEPTLGHALEVAHDRGLGVLAIKGLFSGHLDAQSAIEFVLRHRYIDVLVLGTINPDHLAAAVAVARTSRGN